MQQADAGTGGEGGGERVRRRKRDASTSAGAAAPTAEMKLNPGEWETNVEVAASGLPANVASMMKGTKVTTRTCITPEQASKPSGEIFSGKKQNGCTYKDFTTAGGTIHGTVSCPATGGGGATTMALEGRYGGDSFDVTMKMAAAGGQSGGTMQMETHTSGRRVGACSGKG